MSQMDHVSGLFLSLSVVKRQFRTKVEQASEVSRDRENPQQYLQLLLNMFLKHEWVLLPRIHVTECLKILQ